MKISHRTADAFGYISLILVVLLFISVLTGMLPAYLQLPLFFLALTLYLLRIALRLTSERQRRLEEEKKAQSNEGGV